MGIWFLIHVLYLIVQVTDPSSFKSNKNTVHKTNKTLYYSFTFYFIYLFVFLNDDGQPYIFANTVWERRTTRLLTSMKFSLNFSITFMASYRWTSKNPESFYALLQFSLLILTFFRNQRRQDTIFTKTTVSHPNSVKVTFEGRKYYGFMPPLYCPPNYRYAGEAAIIIFRGEHFQAISDLLVSLIILAVKGMVPPDRSYLNHQLRLPRYPCLLADHYPRNYCIILPFLLISHLLSLLWIAETLTPDILRA